MFYLQPYLKEKRDERERKALAETTKKQAQSTRENGNDVKPL